VAAAPQNSLHLEEARPRASSSASGGRAAALNLSAKCRAFPAAESAAVPLVYRAAGRVIIAAGDYERRPVPLSRFTGPRLRPADDFVRFSCRAALLRIKMSFLALRTARIRSAGDARANTYKRAFIRRTGR